MCRLSSVSKYSTTGTYYYFGNKRLMKVNFRFNITSKINEFLTMIKVYVIFWHEYGSKENYYNWIYKAQYVVEECIHVLKISKERVAF